MFLIVRHQAYRKRLMMPARFLERRLDDVPANAIRSRLQFVPEPAAVSNGRVWKNRSRRNVWLFRRRSFLRPTEVLVQRLTVKPLKGCDPHSGIDEHLIAWFRPDNNHFRLRRCPYKKREQDRQKD